MREQLFRNHGADPQEEHDHYRGCRPARDANQRQVPPTAGEFSRKSSILSPALLFVGSAPSGEGQGNILESIQTDKRKRLFDGEIRRDRPKYAEFTT